MSTSPEPSLRVLRRRDVMAAGASVDAVAVVRDTLALHARGATTLPAEAYLPWHTPRSGAFARSLALPGAVWGPRPAIGLKVINSSLDNPGLGLPRAQGWTFLFDADTARPIAMLEAGWISATRTAAYTVLSQRLLGSGEVTRMAVLGCGALAARHLEMLALDLPRAEAVLHDLDQDRASMLSRTWPGPASVASDARSAVEGAQLVVCTTTTTTGYIPAAWLAPGALVAHVSLDDLLPEAVLAADVLVVDDWELIAADDRRLLGRMWRSGTLTGPSGERFGPGGESARRVDATLAEVVSEAAPGRRHDDDVVVSNPFGMGVLDVALADAVLAVAVDSGLGTVLEP